MNFKSAHAGLVVAPQDDRVMHAFGEELRLHLGGEQTGGKFTMFTEITPPGGGPPPHYHAHEDEWFHVLEGRVAFFQGSQWAEVPIGTSVFMPRNVVHTFKNVGDKPSRMLIQTAPSGFETFFSRCEVEFQKTGGPDMKRIVEISAEHGIHFVSA